MAGGGGGLGDNGPATLASLSSPKGVALDTAGNLYIADSIHGRVRRVSPDGIIHTYYVSALAPATSPEETSAFARVKWSSAR